MALSIAAVPHVDVELSIQPSSHSFTSQSPPNLTLRLTSRAKRCITIVTWGSPLDLGSTLTSNGSIITDTTTERAVATSQCLVQGRAPKRTRGTSDKNYFLTLEPNVAVVLSAAFGRANGSIKPQPKAVVERGWELDENGHEVKIRRSVNATGVDGLEPGRQYRVGLNLEALKDCRWALASKEEVLVDHSGKGSHLHEYPWEGTTLDFSVNEAVLSVLE